MALQTCPDEVSTALDTCTPHRTEDEVANALATCTPHRAEAAEAGNAALALLASMAGDLTALAGHLEVMAAWSDDHGLPSSVGLLRWVAAQAGNVADADTVRLVDDVRNRAERGLA